MSAARRTRRPTTRRSAGHASTLSAMAALALGPVAVVAVAACGADTPTGGEDAAAVADGSTYLAGTVDDWLVAACGEGTALEPSGSPQDRYGPQATEGYHCSDASHPGPTTHVEATYVDGEPPRSWTTDRGPGVRTWAVGQVDAETWVLVVEDSSRRRIPDPHLGALTGYGFDVVENGEPVA